MNLKRNTLIVAFAAVTALGLSGCDNHKKAQNNNPQPAATQTVTTPAPAPVATQPVSGPNHRDGADEKAAKLAKMETGDRQVLQAMGYTADARIGMGRCGADGNADGSGYHGVSTAIEYDVQKGGQHFQVCVAHKGGVPTVGAFKPQ